MAEAERYYSVIVPITIPSGAAVAPVINLERAAAGKFLAGLRLVGVYMSAGWDSAVLSLKAGVDDLTPLVMTDGASGSEYAINVAANKYVKCPPLDFLGPNTLIVCSGSSTVPVNQTADRTLYLVLRQL